MKDSIFYSKPSPCFADEFDSSADYFTSVEESSSCNGLQPTQSSINYALSFREDEFTETKNIVVYCVTWNVSQTTVIGFVSDLFNSSYLGATPDIYAIGFQEVYNYKTLKHGYWGEWAKGALSEACTP